MSLNPADELIATANGLKFQTILADPPWRFMNRTGKVAPEHRRLSRYSTMGIVGDQEVAGWRHRPRACAPIPLGA